MKYALITDNSVQWFAFLVRLGDKTELLEHYNLDSGINNQYLDNIFSREPSFTNLRIAIPGSSIDTFVGSWISAYDFERVKEMISLFPAYCRYLNLGKLC